MPDWRAWCRAAVRAREAAAAIERDVKAFQVRVREAESRRSELEREYRLQVGPLSGVARPNFSCRALYFQRASKAGPALVEYRLQVGPLLLQRGQTASAGLSVSVRKHGRTRYAAVGRFLCCS